MVAPYSLQKNVPFHGDIDMLFRLVVFLKVVPMNKLFLCLCVKISWFLSSQAGSLHGKFIDATPFANSLKKDKDSDKPNSIVDELGPMLASYGFNYHGNEVLYSGVFGTEMDCEIFIGPVYYQRLRHMVSDKFQVIIFCSILNATSIFSCTLYPSS